MKDENGDDRLAPDDVLAQAIGRWAEETPRTDLWPGIAARIAPRRRLVPVTWPQLALAASLLMAVSAGLTWLVARQPEPGQAFSSQERVVRAQSDTMGLSAGTRQQANFADPQFDAAVSDLERVLRDGRDSLDPRTVMVIERNLRIIDDAIRQARRALDDDPANPYLNSHLADARRRKLDLLRRATALEPTGGD